MATFLYFPESMIELAKELKNWPMISAEMQTGNDLSEQFALLGARLGILLDGLYDQEKLADMFVKKLREMRKEVIIDPNYQPPQTIDVTIKEGPNTVVIEAVPAPISLPEKTDP